MRNLAREILLCNKPITHFSGKSCTALISKISECSSCKLCFLLFANIVICDSKTFTRHFVWFNNIVKHLVLLIIMGIIFKEVINV